MVEPGPGISRQRRQEARPGHQEGKLEDMGIYLKSSPAIPESTPGRWTPKTSSKEVIGVTAPFETADLICLKEPIEAGKIETVIDRSYPLEHTAGAHRYVETGQEAGSVVVTLEHDNKIQRQFEALQSGNR